MVSDAAELPDGWIETNLGYLIQPSKTKVEPTSLEEITYIGLEHIESQTGRLLGHGISSEVRSTKSVFKQGDLLYGKLLPYLNKVYLSDLDGICSTDILVFPGSEHLSNQYLAYRFLSDDFVQYANANSTGVQHPRVKFESLSEFSIPLPPLNEQRRIVAKIEALTAHSQRASAALADVPTLIDQFRQSVLAAAFRGDLTADWREQHPDVEPAETLLERIRVDRRQRWKEAELEKMKAKGKEPKDDKWKEKYKEPEQFDAPDLSRLPNSWLWISADECTSLITDGEHATPERTNEGVYLLSARNVLDGELSFEKVDYISEDLHQKLNQRLNLAEGDILLSCSGTVGRSCTVPKGLNCSFVRSVAILKPLLNMGEFLSASIRSPVVQAQIEKKKTQTAQSNLFQGRIKVLALPLAPIQEQVEILRQVAYCMDIAKAIEGYYAENTADLNQLNQSILAKAFRGDLVPQDPDDEPAAVLLERIRAERERLGTVKKSGRAGRGSL